MTDSLDRAILNCSLFAGLGPAALAKVQALARLRRLDRGEVVFREGQTCPGIFVVVKGAVRIYKLAPSGKEYLLTVAGPGETFAEVAVMGGFPCPANARAAEPTTCVAVPRDGFLQLLREDHAFCLDMLAGMAGRVRHLVGLVEDLVLRDATARVASQLLEADGSAGQAEFTLPVSKKDLASHLNLTSETLSRTLRRLVECRLLTMRASALRILDPEGLRAVASGTPPGEIAH